MHVFLTSQFSFDIDSGIMGADASDLGPNFKRDDYIVIESTVTLRKVLFKRVAIHRDVDGDVAWIDYVPTEPLACPRVNHIQIYND